ncbi:cytochrome P450 [Streptomyces sp. NPDC048611]|uniref:cytochrome P450 n=1 Tax=Streptomyces sp. NPDC048611 TaxID=3155635 RepID=UPI003416A675
MPIRTLLSKDDIGNINLADPRTHAENDLSAVWRGLRAQDPVFWHRPVGRNPGFWVVTKYEDVAAVYLDNKRFTSERGNVLASLLAGGDSAAGMMAAVTDGPRHAGIRRILLKAFAPRALHGVVDKLMQSTRRRLAEAVTAGKIDFVEDFAAHIPIRTICDLLGAPSEDHEHLLGLTTTALSSDVGDQSPADIFEARNEILGYFETLAVERRKNPRDDAVSVLATSTLDGKPLTLDEIIANCYSLILGGDDTSRLSISGAALALVENPAQWRALKQGEVEIATAVEEVLRWTTPAMHFGRTALEDVEIGGRTVGADEIVTLWNSSANRDGDVFPNPDSFDLARTPNKHLAFGHGPHFCLGAYLGRAEITAVLTALRDVVATMEPAGEPSWIYSNLLSGMSRLPLSMTAEPRAAH